MGMGRYYVTQHVLTRVRTRWLGASTLDNHTLITLITISIETALQQDKAIKTPSGTFVPFTLLERDGFLVIRRDRVVTALGAEYCPEVCAVQGDKHGSV